MALLDLQGLEIDEDQTAQRRSRHSRHHKRCGGGASRLSLLLC
jgi:SapB morphogen precursor RamS